MKINRRNILKIFGFAIAAPASVNLPVETQEKPKSIRKMHRGMEFVLSGDLKHDDGENLIFKSGEDSFLLVVFNEDATPSDQWIFDLDKFESQDGYAWVVNGHYHLMYHEGKLKIPDGPEANAKPRDTELELVAAVNYPKGDYNRILCAYRELII
ncbi:MAG: hypothetical protein ACW99G_02735 [Candidatus Thorarchaeota archaeon]|jgi:hypothetical protein